MTKARHLAEFECESLSFQTTECGGTTLLYITSAMQPQHRHDPRSHHNTTSPTLLVLFFLTFDFLIANLPDNDTSVLSKIRQQHAKGFEGTRLTLVILFIISADLTMSP
jgi:hypothetical protein